MRILFALTGLFSLSSCASQRPPSALPTTAATVRAVSSPETWVVPTAEDPRGTDALASLARPGAAFLDDGTFVLLGPDGSPAFAALTRDQSLRSQSPHTLAATGCALHPAANGVVRVCPGPADGDARAWWIDRSAVTPIPEPVSPSLLVDATGESVAVNGRCNPSDPDDGTTFCWLRRDLPRWSEWTVPNRSSLLSVRGETALVHESSDTTSTLATFVITASRRTPIVPTDPTLTIDAAGFTPTGDVVVLAHRAQRPGAPLESFACVATVGVPCTARPLSIAAVDIAFADARRGLAVGATADQLSVTTDGGASWQPITPTGHPSPASITLWTPPQTRASRRDRIRPAGQLVRCNTNACAAGRVVHRWDND